MDHESWLLSSCRVCAGRLGRYKVSYDCHSTENQARLQSIGVSVEDDSKEVHPQQFCHGCYNICIRTISANKNGKQYAPKLVKYQWEGHSEECACQKNKRGRIPKKKSPGRPSDLLLDFISSITAQSPTSFFHSRQLREKLSLTPPSEDLICPVCHLVLDRPILIVTCSQMVCLACCVDYAYQHSDRLCPCCSPSHTLDHSVVIPAPPAVIRLLRSLEVTCERCQRSVTAGIHTYVNISVQYNHPPPFLVDFTGHVCAEDVNLPVASLDDVTAKPITEPLSHEEDRLVTSLVRRKLAQGLEDGLLQLKTGGQV